MNRRRFLGGAVAGGALVASPVVTLGLWDKLRNWLRPKPASLSDADHLHGLLGIVSRADPPTMIGNYGSIERSVFNDEVWKVRPPHTMIITDITES